MKVHYQSLIIYYWTGTGNSYRTGCILAERSGELGLAAPIKAFNAAHPEQEIDDHGPSSLLVLSYPTHALTLPWGMLKFIFQLPRRRGTHVLIMPTRGGMKLGQVFVPGIEGTGGYLAALILTIKGYQVRGVQAIDMPSNWVTIHSAYAPETCQAIIQRARERVRSLTEVILAGGKRFRGWLCLAIGLIALPLTIPYLMLGRFFLAKLFFASEKCNGCGLCAKNCPHKAINMTGREGKTPYWTSACESCMRCMNYCPVQAVEASHLLAIILFLLSTLPIAAYLASWLTPVFPQAAKLQTGGFSLLIDYPYALATIFLSYRLFHRLNRWPVLNRMFNFLTLTRFFRRYHEPHTKLTDISSAHGTSVDNAHFFAYHNSEQIR